MSGTDTVLVTGSAGFIGSALTLRLLEEGREVVGLDNFNDYYDPALKHARVARFADHPRYRHVTGDLGDRQFVEQVFSTQRPGRVVNLAAQAGVRYAATNPHAYVSSNVTGFLHVLEGCRHTGVEHLVFASTSSVYGANTSMPFDEDKSTDHPLTLYAATKKANELVAHSYAHLYGVACTGLRFFTVYGPWGRPDMALYLFAEAMLRGEPIRVFNHGRHRRSFTYIDDIVDGVRAVLDRDARPDPDWNSNSPRSATSAAPYRIFNIGGDQAVGLMAYVAELERALGMKAKVEFMPLQAGDVPDTEADIGAIASLAGYRPKVSVEEGVTRFVEWFLKYRETRA